MPLKFKDNSLVDENGNIFPISYETILEECLRHPFSTPSISTIIFDSVRNITGERVLCTKGYNSNPLFIRLEQSIKVDERYQKEKEKAREKYEEKRKIRDMSRINYNTIGRKQFFEKRDCQRARKYYERPSRWK